MLWYGVVRVKIDRIEITRPDVGNDRRHDMIADVYTETCVILHGVEDEIFDTDEELANAIMLGLENIDR